MGGDWHYPTVFYGFELEQDLLWSWLKENKEYQEYVKEELFTDKICLDDDVLSIIKEHVNLGDLEIVNYIPHIYSRWGDEIPKWDEYLENSILVGKRVPEPLTIEAIYTTILPPREEIVSLFAPISLSLVTSEQPAFYNGFLI
ncbi:Hypothetical protein BQ3484_305 [Cedratvirus A11]|uniref:Uncharacterized protein n=1 Tax=Cedratvirus A11 TaxID=1903266 RepID=A0A1M7XUK5_9VIRU|nr:Hypothetical protein BQ3484_305 [Cedratvirus A11]SHO33373.1 Hypothetical protein BQ3484_305 [Cedratvirus A11]